MVASFFSEVGDRDLGRNNKLSGVAPLPGRGADFPSLHDVAFDGYRTVAVRGGPPKGDGGVGLVLDRSIDGRIRRMFPCGCGGKTVQPGGSCTNEPT